MFMDQHFIHIQGSIALLLLLLSVSVLMVTLPMQPKKSLSMTVQLLYNDLV